MTPDPTPTERERIEQAWTELALQLDLDGTHCSWFKAWFAAVLGQERARIEDEIDAWHAAWVAHVEAVAKWEREEHHSTYCETCYVMGSGRDRAEQALATERARAERYAKALQGVERELSLRNQMRALECRHKRGGWGIAVDTDPLSREWQGLQAQLRALEDARRAALTPDAETCVGCARHPEDCACPEPDAPTEGRG